MKDSIYRYFQMGVIQWMSHPAPQYRLLDSLKTLACDEYFDAIEISPIADADTRAKAKRILEQSHMTVGYGAHPRILAGLNLNAVDEEERKCAETELVGIIDEAYAMGAAGVCILAGKWEAEHREEAYTQLLKSCDALCAHAAGYGMMIEMEVFDYDVDKAVLIGPAPLAAKLAADVRMRHSNFGLLLDLSHLPICHENAEFAVRVMRPYITHLHIGNAVMRPDCAAYGDKHPRFGFPNGENDVAELCHFFRILRREGFFRPEVPMVLSIEVKPFGDEDGDIILANTKRVINRAWALLED